jgi:hypothetical protein
VFKKYSIGVHKQKPKPESGHGKQDNGKDKIGETFLHREIQFSSQGCCENRKRRAGQAELDCAPRRAPQSRHLIEVDGGAPSA